MPVNPEQRNFAEYLLMIDNRELPANSMDEVESLYILYSGNMIDEIFSDCVANVRYKDMKDRAILASFNRDLKKLTNKLYSVYLESIQKFQ